MNCWTKIIINYLWAILIMVLMIIISGLVFSIIPYSIMNVIVLFTILYFLVGLLAGYFKAELLKLLWVFPVFIGAHSLKINEFGLLGSLYWIWFAVLNLFILDRSGHIGIELKEIKNNKIQN